MAETNGNGGWKSSVFDEREKAFEAQYHREEELAFKADARAARMLGLWAAERLGLSGEAAGAYARAVQDADLQRPNHLEMLRKVVTDLAAKGITVIEAEVVGRRETLLEEAKKHLTEDLSSGRQRLEPGF